MTALRVLFSRLLDVVLARGRDARLKEEIESHPSLLTEEFVATQDVAGGRAVVRGRG
jgi:hypothetical protein